MDKTNLRKAMRQLLATIEQNEYDTYSNQIKNRFFMNEQVEKASIVGLTISSFPEVDTEEIIKELWTRGKTVVVPKCTPKDRTMTFYKLDSFDQLETVYMHLLEPNPKVTVPVTSDDIDLVVVPGVVYSRTGYRIGYGGGYYDRFLSNYTGATISLAFDMQIRDSIEREEFDLPVDTILTTTETINCRAHRDEEK